jgi:uncharacterized protein (TIGR03905 family)
MFEFKTSGTCSTTIYFDVVDHKVRHISFDHGCNGNGKGISILAEGMDADELVSKLKGVTCGHKQTSCPDQLAQAVEQAIKG